MAVLEGVLPQTEAPSTTAPAQVNDEQLVFVRAVRAAALFVIVTLHVAFPIIYLYNTVSYGDWWVATNFYTLGKVGSPLFTVVSGLLLLNPTKDQPIGVFFKKRFAKVLFPFIAWVFLYLLWRIFFNGEVLTGHDVLVGVVQGPMYYHLWFIQMILGLYLATPILRVYVRHATRTNLTYFMVVWFVTSSILPIFQRFTGITFGIDIVVTTQYVGFFIMGHYLRDMVIQRKHLLPLLAVMVVSLLFTQIATLTLTGSTGGTFDNFFLLNDSFNLVIVAVCGFLILKSLDYELIFRYLPFLRTIIMTVSSCSLGIYFIHIMFIELLASGKLGFKLSAFSFNPLLSIPLTSAVVMLASVITVSLIKKVPYLRVITP
jgi:surface polysaccharide O-acyltransferase-like enzyme